MFQARKVSEFCFQTVLMQDGRVRLAFFRPDGSVLISCLCVSKQAATYKPKMLHRSGKFTENHRRIYCGHATALTAVLTIQKQHSGGRPGSRAGWNVNLVIGVYGDEGSACCLGHSLKLKASFAKHRLQRLRYVRAQDGALTENPTRRPRCTSCSTSLKRLLALLFKRKPLM